MSQTSGIDKDLYGYTTGSQGIHIPRPEHGRSTQSYGNFGLAGGVRDPRFRRRSAPDGRVYAAPDLRRERGRIGDIGLCCRWPWPGDTSPRIAAPATHESTQAWPAWSNPYTTKAS